MLQELMEIIYTVEFEDNGNLSLRSIIWRGESLKLGFRVEHGTGASSNWTIECSGVIEYLLRHEHYQLGLNVWDDHLVIDQHTQSREGVYISKAPKDPDKVVGQLWTAHVHLVDDWIDFDQYLNRELPLRTLLASGNALIATAPSFLASVYMEVLESNRCKPSRLHAADPRVESAQMAHFGDSYVVASRITASRRTATGVGPL